jgi:hypothetical protein
MDRVVKEYLTMRLWEKQDASDDGSLRAERTVIESQLAALADALVSGKISIELAGDAERKYKLRLADIDRELARHARLTVVVDGDHAAGQWATGGLVERRRVLSAILDKVTVVPGRDLPIADRMTIAWKEQTG